MKANLGWALFLSLTLAGLSHCKRHGPPLGSASPSAAKDSVGPSGAHEARTEGPVAEVPSNKKPCSASLPAAGDRLPGVTPEMRTLEYWLSALDDADAPLLTPSDIERLNTDNARRPSAFQDVTAPGVGDQKAVSQQIRERHDWLAKKLGDGKYVQERPKLLEHTQKRVIDTAKPIDSLHVMVASAALRCIPMHEAFRTPAKNSESPAQAAPFDRNQCSGVHAGEVVRALRQSANGDWFYVHTGHSVGWLYRPSWTAELSPPAARSYRDHTPRLVVTAPRVQLVDGLSLAMGASLPIQATDGDVLELDVPSEEGIVSHRLVPPAGVSVGYLPLTRRNLYAGALAYLDHPYGWGEERGGQDCSRLLLDVFATSGLRLGRHSAEQAKAGVRTVKLQGLAVEQRRQRLRAALAEGVVFAYMPGHIMLMLGEREGRFFAVSAIAEVTEPCDSGSPDTARGERVVPVGRVVVSDLSVGAGTSKTSFVERLTKLAVFGRR